MPTLLMIAYHFPPLGGAGTQRSSKLVKRAGLAGWRSAVVSARPPRGALEDESLGGDIPPKTIVRRTRDISASTLLGPLRAAGLGRIARLAEDLVPVDEHLTWRPAARRAALALVRDVGGADAIYTTSAPYAAHLVGRDLKRALGAPWVLDLRDPWTSNERLRRYDPSTVIGRMGRRRDAAVERAAYRECDLITVTSSDLLEHLACDFEIEEGRILLVRNGYDEDDFAGFAPAGRPENEEPIALLYAGSCYGSYDIEGFVRALDLFLERNPAERVTFRVRSRSRGWFERAARRYPRVGAVMDLGGYAPHRDLIREYERAHAAVVRGWDRLAVPGKLYELLRTRLPILGLDPPGSEMSRIIEECGAGISIAPNDPEAGCRAIAEIAGRWRAGRDPSSGYDEAAVSRYERGAQYAPLLSRLDEMADATRSPARG